MVTVPRPRGVESAGSAKGRCGERVSGEACERVDHEPAALNGTGRVLDRRMILWPCRYGFGADHMWSAEGRSALPWRSGRHPRGPPWPPKARTIPPGHRVKPRARLLALRPSPGDPAAPAGWSSWTTVATSDAVRDCDRTPSPDHTEITAAITTHADPGSRHGTAMPACKLGYLTACTTVTAPVALEAPTSPHVH